MKVLRAHSKAAFFYAGIILLAGPLAAQTRRLWVLRPTGEITEYDLETFAPKATVKAPAEAVESPQNLRINHLGQMLFAPTVSLPLDEDDAGNRKVWFWNGHTTSSLQRDVVRNAATTGSNLAITESAPEPYLAADGSHLYWFSNQARRLQRDGVDLSTKNTWSAWRTDLAGAAREDLASITLPECSCPTGGCEESCPYEQIWVPDDGVGKFFIAIQFISGKEQPSYKSTSLYQESAGKWNALTIDPPLRRVLDARDANTILEAIPDTGCCGWANQSDDQTQLRFSGKTLTVFDERAEYKNPDYDVSFYTENGEMSPSLAAVAFTIAATRGPNKPIQLSAQGQADPDESERIRKALLELPAAEVKSIDLKSDETPKRVEFLPHAALVGWINRDEILIVEEHQLIAFNVSNKTRRKTNINVDDAAHVFLR
jgi:hypothetical protein